MQFSARVVSDAKLRETKTGRKVTAFTVAINETYKNREGERVQQTTYVDCSYWNRPNVTDHLTKGLLLGLSGFLTPRAWVDREGNARAGISMRVDDLDFLGGSSRTGQEPIVNGKNRAESPASTEKGKVEHDDDLPF